MFSFVSFSYYRGFRAAALSFLGIYFIPPPFMGFNHVCSSAKEGPLVGRNNLPVIRALRGFGGELPQTLARLKRDHPLEGYSEVELVSHWEGLLVVSASEILEVADIQGAEEPATVPKMSSCLPSTLPSWRQMPKASPGVHHWWKGQPPHPPPARLVVREGRRTSLRRGPKEGLGDKKKEKKKKTVEVCSSFMLLGFRVFML